MVKNTKKPSGTEIKILILAGVATSVASLLLFTPPGLYLIDLTIPLVIFFDISPALSIVTSFFLLWITGTIIIYGGLFFINTNEDMNIPPKDSSDLPCDGHNFYDGVERGPRP